jgi:DNA-binding XRE family transcriptional regulator
MKRNEKKLLENFSQKIKGLRIKEGLTQAQFADKLDVSLLSRIKCFS